VRILRVVAAAGLTVPLVLRNPVVVLLDLVRHARLPVGLRRLGPLQVALVVHRLHLDAWVDPHPRLHLRLVRTRHVLHQPGVTKVVVGK